MVRIVPAMAQRFAHDALRAQLGMVDNDWVKPKASCSSSSCASASTRRRVLSPATPGGVCPLRRRHQGQLLELPEASSIGEPVPLPRKRRREADDFGGELKRQWRQDQRERAEAASRRVGDGEGPGRWRDFQQHRGTAARAVRTWSHCAALSERPIMLQLGRRSGPGWWTAMGGHPIHLLGSGESGAQVAKWRFDAGAQSRIRNRARFRGDL